MSECRLFLVGGALFWVSGGGWRCMGHYFRWVGGDKWEWVGDFFGWVWVGGGEWEWVHCLMMRFGYSYL